jgi:hypothetical protein
LLSKFKRFEVKTVYSSKEIIIDRIGSLFECDHDDVLFPPENGSSSSSSSQQPIHSTIALDFVPALLLKPSNPQLIKNSYYSSLQGKALSEARQRSNRFNKEQIEEKSAEQSGLGKRGPAK